VLYDVTNVHIHTSRKLDEQLCQAPSVRSAVQLRHELDRLCWCCMRAYVQLIHTAYFKDTQPGDERLTIPAKVTSYDTGFLCSI
jgi:hypothetical protein